MTHAVRIHEFGGAEVLQWEELEVEDPGPGQVYLRQTACGLNYIDIYMRSGTYPVELPATLGMEAAGVIEAIGDGVTELAIGDRVAYAMVAGAYAESRLIDAEKLIKLPDTIDNQTAAAMMLKGLTAHYLLFRTYPVKAGDTVLVYAASGGVGLLLTQWATYLGATVIGCVGSQEKAQLAAANGCKHTILYREENIPERIKDFTDGEGVAVVYDGVGKATFDASLDALRPFGMMVSYGNSSGNVEPFAPKILASKGSLYVTRPTLATHTATRELLVDGAKRLIDAVSNGIIGIQINQTWPLSETTRAHHALESRQTSGSTILTT
jgi:NADPH2:quinone reductase